ncbi:hypothetical protein Rhopal_007079-T1 [Rhodotorula paludigena]|uniref:Dol-P-Glc:Glc(2)Man(9)GlcNAc(2)-PP-Dol alpha-1,2-glucosyltransferase n=1 Tax=Rhodotorula paludigena TaxID=86838 RepID=A0AAV5GWZ5_9BASI|nr:hypothetical protein Rhopal_007079-T1 [Rhodotorula paludigena]
MATRLWWACYAAWAAMMVGVAVRINRTVQEPYMDEIFHVPQAQAYCDGDWGYWDSALTTPPGLYLIPAALASLQRKISLSTISTLSPCSLPALRALNLLIGLTLPFLYSSIVTLLSQRAVNDSQVERNGSITASRASQAVRSAAAWDGLVVAAFPLLGWWSWLFYTDMGSVIVVLLCWRAALQRRFRRSAVLGAAGLLFRQTNVVWLAFVVAQVAISELRRSPAFTQVKADPVLANARPGRWPLLIQATQQLMIPSPVDFVRTPVSLVLAAVVQVGALIPVLAAYLPVFGAAIAFVRWNGGIVLGDKANHVPTVHVSQVFYCIAFAGVFFSPHLLSVARVKTVLRSLFGGLSIAHPFLLADNRHFAFYLWRRVINVHAFARYALAPGYLLAATLIWHALAEAGTMSLSTFILFVGATVAVLVPTPLLEPRYFLLPLIILRLYLASPVPSSSSTLSQSATEAAPALKHNHAALRRRRARLFASHRRSRLTRLALEIALYASVQAFCVYLFLEKPFYWDVQVGADGRGLEGRDEREVGRLQRFMW